MKGVIVILGLIGATIVKAQDADDIFGTYLIDEGDSKVEIYQANSSISGKVVWLEEEDKGNGPILDDKNSLEELRTRPVMGLVVFKDLRYKNGKWSGNIYSPRKGKYYDATFVLNPDSGKLNVQIKVAFLTINRYWTRV